MKIHNILDDINCQAQAELTKAEQKHGMQPHLTLPQQYLILMEEVGEIANAIYEQDYDNARVEIAQSMAMLIKLYWLIENRGN
jgi:NTP pyrophosphatase (non-canonical NTP hydrolase)